MRRRGGCRLAVALLAALAVSTAAAAADRAPSPIVERTLTVTGRTVRTSLFDNGVAVVSVRRGSERVLLRSQTLEEGEFAGYLAALGRDAEELARPGQRRGTHDLEGNGLITLYVGPGAPRRLRYSSVAVLDLATARLVATLDDIEARVVWGQEQAPELATWEPRRGDRVELRSGAVATVRDVREDGTLILEHDDSGINEMVPVEARKDVILRLLESSR